MILKKPLILGMAAALTILPGLVSPASATSATETSTASLSASSIYGDQLHSLEKENLFKNISLDIEKNWSGSGELAGFVRFEFAQGAEQSVNQSLVDTGVTASAKIVIQYYNESTKKWVNLQSKFYSKIALYGLDFHRQNSLDFYSVNVPMGTHKFRAALYTINEKGVFTNHINAVSKTVTFKNAKAEGHMYALGLITEADAMYNFIAYNKTKKINFRAPAGATVTLQKYNKTKKKWTNVATTKAGSNHKGSFKLKNTLKNYTEVTYRLVQSETSYYKRAVSEKFRVTHYNNGNHKKNAKLISTIRKNMKTYCAADIPVIITPKKVMGKSAGMAVSTGAIYISDVYRGSKKTTFLDYLAKHECAHLVYFRDRKNAPTKTIAKAHNAAYKAMRGNKLETIADAMAHYWAGSKSNKSHLFYQKSFNSKEKKTVKNYLKVTTKAKYSQLAYWK